MALASQILAVVHEARDARWEQVGTRIASVQFGGRLHRSRSEAVWPPVSNRALLLTLWRRRRPSRSRPGRWPLLSRAVPIGAGTARLRGRFSCRRAHRARDYSCARPVEGERPADTPAARPQRAFQGLGAATDVRDEQLFPIGRAVGALGVDCGDSRRCPWSHPDKCLKKSVRAGHGATRLSRRRIMRGGAGAGLSACCPRRHPWVQAPQRSSRRRRGRHRRRAPTGDQHDGFR
jgi:hypothetical protein